MSPDFYIRIFIEIKHINGISYYDLQQKHGYFDEINIEYVDSDNEEDEKIKKLSYELYKNMVNICLTPRKPVVLYRNNNFINKKIKEKYLPIIIDKIHTEGLRSVSSNEVPFGGAQRTQTGIISDISEIIEVTKHEERYEPV